MKAIFKIEEYLPDTTQIVVRFARLHAPESIEKYKKVAIDYSQLDCYDSDSFVKSLMRKVGDHMVKLQEESEPINNIAETISGDLDLEKLIGKTIECKVDNNRRERLKMRRVEL
tara:strand:- start:380 stop:721 length:342 start_codon:yes stop_codon:yes gene_type:complete